MVEEEFRMVDQSKSSNPDQAPSNRRSRRGAFLIALVAVALLAGITGNLLSTAFGQGDGWHHISWHHGGFFGGPPSPAQIDDRIDRMTKHMAIELDATADQQAKVAAIAKAAVADLRPLREKAQAARAQAITLLTAPTIDRSAIARLRPSRLVQASAGGQSRWGLPKGRATAWARRWPMSPRCSTPNSAGKSQTGWHSGGHGGRAGIAADGHRLMDNRGRTRPSDRR